MSIAPTEKHIEDWIVDNLNDFKNQTSLPIHRIVSRQSVMPSGIADLIVMMPLSLTVIEIKKERIDSKAVSQLLRYISDISKLHEVIYQQVKNESDPLAHGDNISRDHGCGRSGIHGILIGNSIDLQTLLHCQNRNIEYIEYSWVNGCYEFQRDPYYTEEYSDIYFDYELVSAVKELMRHLKLYNHDQETLKAIFKGWRNE